MDKREQIRVVNAGLNAKRSGWFAKDAERFIYHNRDRVLELFTTLTRKAAHAKFAQLLTEYWGDEGEAN